MTRETHEIAEIRFEEAPLISDKSAAETADDYIADIEAQEPSVVHDMPPLEIEDIEVVLNVFREEHGERKDGGENEGAQEAQDDGQTSERQAPKEGEETTTDDAQKASEKADKSDSEKSGEENQNNDDLTEQIATDAVVYVVDLTKRPKEKKPDNPEGDDTKAELPAGAEKKPDPTEDTRPRTEEATDSKGGDKEEPETDEEWWEWAADKLGPEAGAEDDKNDKDGKGGKETETDTNKSDTEIAKVETDDDGPDSKDDEILTGVIVPKVEVETNAPPRDNTKNVEVPGTSDNDRDAALPAETQRPEARPTRETPTVADESRETPPPRTAEEIREASAEIIGSMDERLRDYNMGSRSTNSAEDGAVHETYDDDVSIREITGEGAKVAWGKFAQLASAKAAQVREGVEGIVDKVVTKVGEKTIESVALAAGEDGSYRVEVAREVSTDSNGQEVERFYVVTKVKDQTGQMVEEGMRRRIVRGIVAETRPQRSLYQTNPRLEELAKRIRDRAQTRNAFRDASGHFGMHALVRSLDDYREARRARRLGAATSRYLRKKYKRAAKSEAYRRRLNDTH